MQTDFRITDFCNVLRPANQSGERLYMKDRYASSFIFVVRGKIRFTDKNGVYIADSDHPVYIPQGAEYLNECIADAESYMVSFYDNGAQKSILPLDRVDGKRVAALFNRIEALCFDVDRNRFEILSLLYGITALINEKDLRGFPERLGKALKILEASYQDPDLEIRDIAGALYISEIYLRELFSKHLGLSPQKYLNKLRMEKAKIYLLERKTVTVTAALCGYANIYSFSRAYKRFYGFPPRKTGEMR